MGKIVNFTEKKFGFDGIVRAMEHNGYSREDIKDLFVYLTDHIDEFPDYKEGIDVSGIINRLFATWHDERFGALT